MYDKVSTKLNFAENEEKKLPAKELYHSVQASLSKMTDLVKEIIFLLMFFKYIHNYMI